MLAIGRGLMARPKLLMLDEPSLGLAPRLVTKIFDLIVGLRAERLLFCFPNRTLSSALRSLIAATSLRMDAWP